MKPIERIQHWIVYRDTPGSPYGRRMKLKRHLTLEGALRHARRVGGYTERHDAKTER
jgi:hypothetical protein